MNKKLSLQCYWSKISNILFSHDKVTRDVDVVHVSSRDLISDLLYESESKLNIISLTGLGIDVPGNDINCPHVLDTIIIFSSPSPNLPSILVSVRSDNDGVVPQEVAEGMSVAMAPRPVEMEHNWHLLSGTGGGDGNLGSPREGLTAQ